MKRDTTNIYLEIIFYVLFLYQKFKYLLYIYRLTLNTELEFFRPVGRWWTHGINWKQQNLSTSTLLDSRKKDSIKIIYKH